MSPRKETIRLLLKNSYVLKRSGGNHDIYYSSVAHKTIPVKRHDFNENDMRYILKEAGISGKEN